MMVVVPGGTATQRADYRTEVLDRNTPYQPQKHLLQLQNHRTWLYLTALAKTGAHSPGSWADCPIDHNAGVDADAGW